VRVFADAKEKHGMRYTQPRGLRKVQHYLTLFFACMKAGHVKTETTDITAHNLSVAGGAL